MTIKVSVCIIAYNQGAYIGQCLQSIVDQQVDFEFEVLVSDDCSTDNSRAIITDYYSRYPTLIKPILHEKNIGGAKNFVRVHNAAIGEFVCHCDGDDYFLPGKLQKQFDYLATHPDCAAVWHRAKIEEGGQSYLLGNPADFLPNGFIDTQTLLRVGSIGIHSTLMYRKSARVTKDENLVLLDFYYALEFLQSGYGHFIDEVLGVYRRYPIGGSYTSSRKGYLVAKKLLARHYADFLATHQQYRNDVFVGTLFDFIYDAATLRKSCLAFVPVLIKSFSLFAIPDVFKVLGIKIRLLKRTEVN